MESCRRMAVLMAVALAGASQAASAEPRAVIELFTSQGCSSCPPADKLLGELADDPSLIAISVPIDYWDYLGWKDTLANPRNTARQKAYAHVRGDGQVYTPQAVVNGSIHALGSDRAAIEHAIELARAGATDSLLPLSLAVADGRINLNLPQANEGPAEAWLCGLMKATTIAIGRGENKGRTITYRNVVRRWVKLGDWGGRARSLSVPLQTLAGDGIDEAAVLLQVGTTDKPRAILGAAIAALH